MQINTRYGIKVYLDYGHAVYIIKDASEETRFKVDYDNNDIFRTTLYIYDTVENTRRVLLTSDIVNRRYEIANKTLSFI